MEVFYTATPVKTIMVHTKHQCSTTQSGFFLGDLTKSLDFQNSVVMYPHKCNSCGFETLLVEPSPCLRYIYEHEEYDVNAHTPKSTPGLGR